MKSKGTLLAALGPGILFAAAAVGVSHLVQATRAGAMFGPGMISIIIIACLLKYPAIRFGSDYTAATGRSLIQSYRQSGLWILVLYGIAQVFSMFFIVAAVSLVTASLLKATLNIEINDLLLVAGLLFVVSLLLLSGRYHLLEKLSKIIVPLFTLLIVAAVMMVVRKIEWSLASLAWPEYSAGTMMFVVALAGFMPAPLDASIFQSLWTKAKAEDTGRLPTLSEARFDFNVGFITSLLLALCFMLMGAGVMHNAGVPLAGSSGGFASQVIELFTSTIGQWSYPIISAAAITVMFSTQITLLDAYPRILDALANELIPAADGRIYGIKIYDLMLILACLGALCVMGLFMRSFAAFIDLTSVIVFILGPFLAFMNHRAVFGGEIPVSEQPSSLMRVWSVIGIVAMALIGVFYLSQRLL
ncbi:MAG: divalent metal cation transporter [Halioglobus sp.]